MPMASVSDSSKTIDVVTLSVSINPLPASSLCGTTQLTFSGTVSPAPPEEGYVADIYETDAGGNFDIDNDTPVASGPIASGTGNYAAGMPAPYSMGCATHYFRTVVESGIGLPPMMSSVVNSSFHFPTGFSQVNVPPQVGVGIAFEIYGDLLYESSAGVWSPVAGETVNIKYGTITFGNPVTDSNGHFSATNSISTTGVKTITFSFAGTGTLASAMLKLAYTGAVNILIPLLIGGALVYVSTRVK